MCARQSYEGMDAYNAGIKEGRRQFMEEFNRSYKPFLLTVLSDINECEDFELVIERVNNLYDAIDNGITVAIDCNCYLI